MKKKLISGIVLIFLLTLNAFAPLILTPSTGFAADVTTNAQAVCKWLPNSESDLAGYRLYQSNQSGVYTVGDGNQVATIPKGTETVTLDLGSVPDGTTYYWVLTAYDTAGNESGPSQEASKTFDAGPDNPQGFTVSIQVNVNVNAP